MNNLIKKYGKGLIIAALLTSIVGGSLWLAETESSEARAIAPKSQTTKSLFDGVLKGDGNNDGRITVLDLALLIDYVRFQVAMDLNNDKKVNEKDVEILVDQIFGSGAYKNKVLATSKVLNNG